MIIIVLEVAMFRPFPMWYAGPSHDRNAQVEIRLPMLPKNMVTAMDMFLAESLLTFAAACEWHNGPIVKAELAIRNVATYRAIEFPVARKMR
jgi:hypothetical protein